MIKFIQCNLKVDLGKIALSAALCITYAGSQRDEKNG